MDVPLKPIIDTDTALLSYYQTRNCADGCLLNCFPPLCFPICVSINIGYNTHCVLVTFHVAVFAAIVHSFIES